MMEDFEEFFPKEIKKIDIDYSSLNKQQLEAVNTINGPVLIIAGAGSGKTKTLVYRLINLINNGIDPERILLLTFTNKAAGEMLERAQTMLDERVNKITACTYHSFCAKVLRKYHNLVGIDDNYTILSPSNCAEVLNIIKEKIDLDEDTEIPSSNILLNIFSFAINKNMDISEIVEMKYSKFEGEISTIELLKEKYDEYKIENNSLDYDDLLVLTNKLFNEYPKVCKRYSDIYKYIMVDEYQDSNSLQLEFLSLLRKFDNKNICVVGDDQQCFPEKTPILTNNGLKNIEDITLEDELIVASGKGETCLLKPESVIKNKYSGKLIVLKTKSGKEIKATPNHIVFAKTDKSIDKKECLKFSMFKSSDKGEICYKHELINGNAKMIFKDQDKLIEVAEKTLSSSNIYFSNENLVFLRNAILTKDLDEYEFLPISEIQKGMFVSIYDKEIISDEVISIKEEYYEGYVYDLNIPICRNYIAGGIVVHNCIYSWRGANFKNIINFPNHFKGTKLIKLIQNYRSNQEILDLSNAILNNATEKYEKQLLGQTEKGELPLFVHVDNSKEQCRYILNKIEQYHKYDKIPYSDMAVLIRGGNDSYDLEMMIQENIGRIEIPFKKFGGLKFLDKEICQDIFAYLGILTNPKSHVLWFRLLKLYPFIGRKNSVKIADELQINGIDELLNKKYEKRKYANYLLEIYNEYNKMKSIKDLDVLVDYLINSYYFKVKKRSIEESKIGSKSKKTTKADLLNKLDEDILEAQMLISTASKYSKIDEYLEALALEATPDPEEDNKDYLTISTIHSAKGLEFKIVFILNCIDSSFPGERPLSSYSYAALREHEEEIEESRRLLYVAITRAKEDLYLMCPEFIIKFGRLEKTEVSRFLEEDDIYKDYCKNEYK